MDKSLRLIIEGWRIKAGLAETNLCNLLKNPVGIGEHVRLTDDIETLFKEALEYNHLVEEAEKYLQSESTSTDLKTESSCCQSKQPIGFSNGIINHGNSCS